MNNKYKCLHLFNFGALVFIHVHYLWGKTTAVSSSANGLKMFLSFICIYLHKSECDSEKPLSKPRPYSMRQGHNTRLN